MRGGRYGGRKAHAFRYESAFAQRLTKYNTATGSIQFPFDQPLPLALITAITKFRVRELNEKDGKWKE